MTATATVDAARAAAEISARITARRDQAAAEWKALARLVADTFVEPDSLVISDLGAALGLAVDDSPKAFANDVSALREHPKHLAQAAATFAAIERNLEPYGGDMSRVAAALKEAEAALANLRRLVDGTPWLMQSAELSKATAARLVERHPRVFGG
jgi:hypothetical protein